MSKHTKLVIQYIIGFVSLLGLYILVSYLIAVSDMPEWLKYILLH